GTMQAHIPASSALSTQFRVRVISTNPVIISNDNGSDITVQQQIVPTITTSSSMLCAGITNTLTCGILGGGTAPYTYTWSTSATDNNVTDVVVAYASTSYSVNVTDVNGCTGSAYTNLTLSAFDNVIGTINDTGTSNPVS